MSAHVHPCSKRRGYVSVLTATLLLGGGGLSAALWAQDTSSRPPESPAVERIEGTPKPERPRVNRRGPPPRLPDTNELALMERLVDLEPEKLRRLIEFLERVEEMSPEQKEVLKQRIDEMRKTFKRISAEDREWLKFYTLSLPPEERESHFQELRVLQPDQRAQYLQAQLETIRATGITLEELQARAHENVLENGLPRSLRRERLERLREEGNLTDAQRQELRERLRERRSQTRPSGLEPPASEDTGDASQTEASASD
ncbi:MAG: DUF3106 domain-containing protein [Opitutales bacterium]